MLKVKKIALIYCLIMFFYTPYTIANCVLKMGYKEGEKIPMIGAEGNDNGVYKELFSLAAERIGCRLAIIRSSKKRIHKRLRTGSLDFYPGASFSTPRSEYLQYVKNGLSTAEYGLTPSNIDNIENYAQVKYMNLTWLMELGSSKQEISDRLLIKTQQSHNVNIDKVMLYFETRDVHFYVVDKEVVDYFTLNKPDYFLEYNGLKLHKNCCGGQKAMYLGFSKKSRYYNAVKNPLFDQNKPVTVENQTDQLAKESIVEQFSKSLMQLQLEGVTQNIYDKYLTFKSKQFID